jgi:hypothetical protein
MERRLALAPDVSQAGKDNPGLLRLKSENGRFIVEIDGVVADRSLSPEKKKRLIELITVFRPWLDAAQPGQPAPKPAAAVPPQPPAAPIQEPVSRPIQPASLSPIKPEPEKKLGSLSIVQQIDSVLQARIMDTPLAKQGLRLQESLQGGVEVYVGLQKYLTVDEVPDEVIKSTIRAAIAEWEAKYTPGI